VCVWCRDVLLFRVSSSFVPHIGRDKEATAIAALNYLVEYQGGNEPCGTIDVSLNWQFAYIGPSTDLIVAQPVRREERRAGSIVLIIK
jgi:hypothetical protein